MIYTITYYYNLAINVIFMLIKTGKNNKNKNKLNKSI